ncbi:proteasome subunit beta [Candidatus Woesearchaeota archaeon]|nr:proteasome subunit beta [Candidatus Woesearchaeota archaeon]
MIRMVDDKNFMKTGTTTIAVKCKDGVVLAADKRVTSGYLVANKKFNKIININDKIAVTTAGTVSDVQLMVKLLKAELKLKDIRTNRESFVNEAVNLLSNLVYSNIRKFSIIPGISHFIVGGTDNKGQHIFDVGADGSVTEIDDYVSSGSGSVMAYGVLEALYKEDLAVQEAVSIAKKAINAAVQRDIASGNGIDIVTITNKGVKKELTKQVSYKIE